MNKLIKAGQHLLSCDKLRAVSLTPPPAHELKKLIPNPFRSEHALLTITYDNHHSCIDCINLTGMLGNLLCKILASWYF